MKRFVCILAMMLVVIPAFCCAESNTIEFRVVFDTKCDGCQAMPYQQKTLFVGPVALSDMDIQDTEIKENVRLQSLTLVLYFTEKGRYKFSDITGENIGRRLAIIARDKIITVPVIRERIDGGEAHITGNLTKNELEIIEQQIQANVKKRRAKYLGSGQGRADTD